VKETVTSQRAQVQVLGAAGAGFGTNPVYGQPRRASLSIQ
jgi:hypothetical protein